MEAYGFSGQKSFSLASSKNSKICKINLIYLRWGPNKAKGANLKRKAGSDGESTYLDCVPRMKSLGEVQESLGATPAALSEIKNSDDPPGPLGLSRKLFFQLDHGLALGHVFLSRVRKHADFFIILNNPCSYGVTPSWSSQHHTRKYQFSNLIEIIMIIFFCLFCLISTKIAVIVFIVLVKFMKWLRVILK